MPKLICSECGSELMEVGFPDELGFQKYCCPNGCKFKPPLWWKVWNGIGMAILLMTTLLLVVSFGIGFGIYKILKFFRISREV